MKGRQAAVGHPSTIPPECVGVRHLSVRPRSGEHAVMKLVMNNQLCHRNRRFGWIFGTGNVKLAARPATSGYKAHCYSVTTRGTSRLMLFERHMNSPMPQTQWSPLRLRPGRLCATHTHTHTHTHAHTDDSVQPRAKSRTPTSTSTARTQRVRLGAPTIREPLGPGAARTQHSTSRITLRLAYNGGKRTISRLSKAHNRPLPLPLPASE